jgi:hypothetical protein
MTDVPTFADDSVQQELAQDDPLSNSPVKGAIKWNQRDNEYAFIWWQTPFWIATDNGGYSMTEDLLDDVPEHIDQIWVVDDKTHKFKLFTRAQYEGDESVVIDPDDPRFENVTPERQVAVDRKNAYESHDLGEVEL